MTLLDLDGVGFELPMDVLRARRNVKWTRYAPDVLPAWVAEMDFSVAYPIRRAMERILREQDYGYPYRNGGSADDMLAHAFAARMKARFGWEVDTEQVQPLADLVQGTFSSIVAFSEPGDGVVLQIPAYPPFHHAIAETGRRLIAHRLPDDGTRRLLDIDGLAKLIDTRTRMILLCNPQNPTGRVFSRTELLRLSELAIERDLIILSDEIHADLVHPDAKHIPLASLSPEIAARVITITSATKSFNIPGLRCGVMHFGTPELRARFHQRVPRRMLGEPGITGIDATVAAWTESQAWLDAVLPHLGRMRDRLTGFLKSELPEIRCYAPEATYLAWLDCSRLELDGTGFDFFHDRAGIAFSPGEAFDPECRQFVRFNFATSASILDQILGRMVSAVRQGRRGLTGR